MPIMSIFKRHARYAPLRVHLPGFERTEVRGGPCPSVLPKLPPGLGRAFARTLLRLLTLLLRGFSLLLRMVILVCSVLTLGFLGMGKKF